MHGIGIFDKNFPRVTLSKDEVQEHLGVTTPPRDAEGKIDLSQSPLTKLLEKKEREALDRLGEKEGHALKIVEHGAELDAFQRQLLTRGIDGSSPMGALLAAFWRPDEIGVFAEYVERAVFLSEHTLQPDEVKPSDIIASTKAVKGSMTATVPRLQLVGTTEQKKAKRTVAGAGTKTYELSESEDTYKLEEYGFKLKIQDIAKDSETVDTASLIIQELAAENNLRAEVEKMVELALDATAGTGFDEAQEFETSTLTWEDILKFFYGGKNASRFPDVIFTTNYAEGAVIDMVNILNLATVTDPMAVPGSVTSDVLPTLRGRKLKFHSSTDLKDKLIGIRKNFGFVKAENRNAMQSEWERIATGGWNVYHWKTNKAFGLITDSAITRLVKA